MTTISHSVSAPGGEGSASGSDANGGGVRAEEARTALDRRLVAAKEIGAEVWGLRIDGGIFTVFRFPAARVAR